MKLQVLLLLPRTLTVPPSTTTFVQLETSPQSVPVYPIAKRLFESTVASNVKPSAKRKMLS